MKTMIDIPDMLYKKAKIHAIETGRTAKDIVLASLIKELEPSGACGFRYFYHQRLERPSGNHSRILSCLS